VTFNHGVVGSIPTGLTINSVSSESPSPTEFVMVQRDNSNGNQRRSMIALGVVVVLFVVGWILARELYSGGKLEDCLMSGRTNCVPLDTQSH
jgi:hypothetical protein